MPHSFPCTGSTATCPAVDHFVASGVVCNSSVGLCDPAETCTGSSGLCPTDVYSPVGTSCRAIAGVCDSPELCAGGAQCPDDSFQGPPVMCRPSAGVCDFAEVCSGSSAACPTDTFAGSGTSCRAAAAICDVAELCTGASATCPTDAFVPNGVIPPLTAVAVSANETYGTAYVAGDVTSVIKSFSGTTCGMANDYVGSCYAMGTAPDAVFSFILTSTTSVVIDTVGSAFDTTLLLKDSSFTELGCNDDAIAPQSRISATLNAGTYYVVVDGWGTTCGAYRVNIGVPPATTCRASAGVCDRAEVCSGGAADCPADSVQPSLITCRASTGTCDAPDHCDGTATTCPADLYTAAGTACAGGTCDGASTCTTAVEIAVGSFHACARRAAGSAPVVCWGTNGSGQIGDGTSGIDRLSPVVVPGLTDAVELSAGGQHTCARRAGGTVVCWGSNASGQIGDSTVGTNRLAPTTVSGLTDAVEIAAGNNHTCARRTGGTVVCWGANANGQLGDNTIVQKLIPTAVSGLTDAVEISAGDTHTCARRTGGTVVCWGLNGNGQLGDNTLVQKLVPTTVVGLAAAAEITVGYRHTCARNTANALYCWGLNTSGQLGDGTVTQRQVPTVITAIAGFTPAELSTGYASTCARSTAGAVRCWGDNNYGQLGDGTLVQHSLPTLISGPANAAELSLGTFFSCLRRSTGTVACNGYNYPGSVGDGTTIDKLVPTTVINL